MKLSLLFSACLLLISTLTFAQKAAKYDPATGFKIFLEFDKPSQKLGKVKKGEKRSGTFTFTNITNEVVTIDIASACSCTTLKYPTTPLRPGQRGKIDFVFDSSEKDESETIGIEIFFKNQDKKMGVPGMGFIEYSFELVK